MTSLTKNLQPPTKKIVFQVQSRRLADLFKPGLHNIRPVGHMRPARSFLAARENSVAENVAKARLRIITCPFKISSTL